MAKLVLAVGWFLLLAWLLTVFVGYAALTGAARTLTGAVARAWAGQPLVGAAAGGAYVTEGLDGSGLTLNLAAADDGVTGALTAAWPGSVVTPIGGGALQWTLPPAAATGFDVTGPVRITDLTAAAGPPPAIQATLQIPVAVSTVFGRWSGVITRALTLPLAGQVAPATFVPYTTTWMATYQAAWPAAPTATVAGQPVLAPTGSAAAPAPAGIWCASARITVPTAGVYTLTVQAQDAAAVWVNGTLAATVAAASNPNGVTVSWPLPAGPQVVAVEAVHNGTGTRAIPAPGTTAAGGTWAAVTLTNSAGQAVLTAATPGWTMDAWPAVAPPGTVTQGLLP